MTQPTIGPGTSPSAIEVPVVQMIATDIDGTMLRPDGTLSPRVRDSLHRAHEAGIHVVPTTGRPRAVADDVIAALGLNHYWIFANGAVTRHLGRDEMVRAIWMEVDVATGLIEELRQAHPSVGFAVEMERDVAYEPGFEQLVPQAPSAPGIPDVLAELARSGQRLQKVLVFHPVLNLDELHEVVNDVIGDHAVASYSGLDLIEIGGRLVTKATAIEALANDLGIDRQAIATFGDNHNDVPMLSWSGHSFAMGNATDDAKMAAQRTIQSNEVDGLAAAVDELVEAFVNNEGAVGG